MAVLVIVVLLGGAYLIARPRLATTRTGDAGLLTALGEPDGVNAVAAVLVQRGRPDRYAGIGADEHRPFEIGSNTKTLTGMLLADAVRRSEVSLEDRLGRWLDLADSPAAGTTLLQLATHTSGLPRDGAHTSFTLCWVVGTNCLGADEATVLEDLRAAALTSSGTAAYSNLGVAALGQALARAAGTSQENLFRRITGPLGMAQTLVQTPTSGPLADRGYQPWGLRPQNWVMDGYQASGGLVSTAADLGRYLRAMLERRAPGMAAIEPRAPMAADQVGHITDVQVGLLWLNGRLNGHRVLFHTGGTAGYRSVLMVDLDGGRAVAVLSNVNTPMGLLAERLLRHG